MVLYCIHLNNVAVFASNLSEFWWAIGKITWPHLFTKYCLNNNGLHIEGFAHLKIYETNKLLRHHRKTGLHQESMLPHFQDGFKPKPRVMDIHISHSAQTWSTNYVDPYLRWSGHTSLAKAFSKFWTNTNQLVQSISWGQLHIDNFQCPLSKHHSLIHHVYSPRLIPYHFRLIKLCP